MMMMMMMMMMILGLRWSNMKFVLLHRPWAILQFTSVMWWITLVRTLADVLNVQMPLLNALLVTNTTLSHIFLKARFLGLHFCDRHYNYIFNHFYVIGAQSYRIPSNLHFQLNSINLCFQLKGYLSLTHSFRETLNFGPQNLATRN